MLIKMTLCKFQIYSVFSVSILFSSIVDGRFSSKHSINSPVSESASNNTVEEEPDWLDQYVTVNGKGEVHPVHLGMPYENAEYVLGVIPEKRIIGGRDVNKGDMPYQTSQQFGVKKSHICGGSIYNSFTILTAAHCFYYENGTKLSDILINFMEYAAGDHNLFKSEESEQRTSAASHIIHPDYEPKSGLNDIAIVKVKNPFVYNKYVQPLPIDYPPLVPEKGMTPFQVKWAWISGWGYTKQRTSGDSTSKLYFPAVLKRAQVEVFQRQECVNFFTKKYSRQLLNRLANGAICAGERASAGTTIVTDGCQGDSGGPLACMNPLKHNLRFLCGLVSTGIGCGLPGLPGIYTRVADFQRWIISEAGYADRRTFNF